MTNERSSKATQHINTLCRTKVPFNVAHPVLARDALPNSEIDPSRELGREVPRAPIDPVLCCGSALSSEFSVPILTFRLPRVRKVPFNAVLELSGALIRGANPPQLGSSRFRGPRRFNMGVLAGLDDDVVLDVVSKNTYVRLCSVQWDAL